MPDTRQDTSLTTPTTLIVPLDGSESSERALPVATAIAGRINGKIVLLCSQYHGPLEPHAYLEEQAVGHDRVAGFIATKDDHAAKAIAAGVAETDGRMVCMATHGRGRFRWAAVGSVAEDVIRHTAGPLLLVGRSCQPDFLDHPALLACADGNDDTSNLATTSQAWATQLGLDLHVAMVAHPLDVESAEHSDAVCAAMVSRFGGPDTAQATLLRSSYVAGAIADYANELPAALIAMNSHARGGLARFALGSVTMATLHLAPCPLLVTHNAA